TVVMVFKMHYNIARPAEVSPDIHPLILTPGHASYPAGHSTEAHLVSTVLKALLTESNRGRAMIGRLSEQLDKLAIPIGENRIVAGLHYRQDIEQGTKLGKDLGDLVVALAKVSNANGSTPCLRWLYHRAKAEFLVR